MSDFPCSLCRNITIIFINRNIEININITVWKTWLSIAYSDERGLYYQFSLPHLYMFYFKNGGRIYFLKGLKISLYRGLLQASPPPATPGVGVGSSHPTEKDGEPGGLADRIRNFYHSPLGALVLGAAVGSLAILLVRKYRS